MECIWEDKDKAIDLLMDFDKAFKELKNTKNTSLKYKLEQEHQYMKSYLNQFQKGFT